MGWKSVAWAGCLVPVLAGCGALRHHADGDPDRSATRRGIARDQRRDAREAWQAVRTGHATRAFSDEFRDGFHDGYADYLDRGDGAQPPAVPPNRYAREPYTAPDGMSLVRDYYSGFEYGKGVAIASGRRASGASYAAVPPPPVVPYVPAPTGGAKPAPTPLPQPRPQTSDSPPGASKFDTPPETKPNGKKPADAEPLPPLPGLPEGAARPIPPLPKPEVPVIKPFNPPLLSDPGVKLGPLPVPPDPDRLPAPSPPLPIPATSPLPVPAEPARAPVALPSVLSQFPVIPFRFDPPGTLAPPK